MCRYKSQISSNNKNGQNHEGIERKPSDNIVDVFLSNRRFLAENAGTTSVIVVLLSQTQSFRLSHLGTALNEHAFSSSPYTWTYIYVYQI